VSSPKRPVFRPAVAAPPGGGLGLAGPAVLGVAEIAQQAHHGGMEHEPITPMSDDEAELFRFLRFGQLPDRVPPGQLVETVQTDVAPEDPPSDDVHRYGY